MNHYYYHAFGLLISSEMHLPEFLESEPGVPDVLIKKGTVPGSLKNPKSSGVRYQASPGFFLMTLDHIARFYVTSGTEIILEVFPGAKEEDVRLFLLGSAMGALLHQRNLLVLHGSAVAFGTEAVIFAGLSGVGKSTLVASLMKHGLRFITDDVCAIDLTHEELPMVQPGYPQVKLWTDAILRMGDQPENHRKLRDQIEKYGWNAQAYFISEEIPAGKVLILSTRNSKGHSMEEIKGIEKFTALRNNTYRIQFVDGLGLTKEHFNMSGELAKHVRVFRLIRSLSPDTNVDFATFVFENLTALQH